VARAHARTRDTFGPLRAGQGWPLAAFYPRALAVLDDLTARFDAALWAGVWPQLRPLLEQAPAPSQAVPLLLDWSGGQFVWRDGQPFALVDVEASVFGPPELDLCSWEGALSLAGAAAFQAGYQTQRPFPDLAPHRAACRLILRALEMNGPPIRTSLDLPALFAPIFP